VGARLKSLAPTLILFRRALPADGTALERLEELAERHLPDGPLLIAEVDDEFEVRGYRVCRAPGCPWGWLSDVSVDGPPRFE